MKITVMEVVDPEFTAPVSYWVDVPCDNEFSETKVRRIRIPREMALYIKQLQDSNSELKEENANLRMGLKRKKGEVI